MHRLLVEKATGLLILVTIAAKTISKMTKTFGTQIKGNKEKMLAFLGFLFATIAITH